MGTERQSFLQRRKGDTRINVLLGAGAGFWLPILGQLIAGGISGYLQQEGPVPGARIGAIAGIASALPGLLFGGLFTVPAIVLPLLGGDATGGFEFTTLFVLINTVFVGIAGLAVSAIVGTFGGFVGAALFESG